LEDFLIKVRPLFICEKNDKYIIAFLRFDSDTTSGQDPPYKDSDTAVVTFVVNNSPKGPLLEKTKNWEKAYLEFMKNYTERTKPDFMKIAYSAERSIEDELARTSEAEITTVAISYIIMFFYIAVNLGQIRSFTRLFVS
jgi:Niemann-Pick C1 protein